MTAENGLMLFEKPTLPELWDYKTSVNKLQQFIYKWKNITQEIANELWIARENLSEIGNPTGANQYGNGANASIPTWSDYCEEIGVNKSTANRWLTRWFPKELGEGSVEDKSIKYDPSAIKKRGVLQIFCPHCDHVWKIKIKEISHV